MAPLAIALHVRKLRRQPCARRCCWAGPRVQALRASVPNGLGSGFKVLGCRSKHTLNLSQRIPSLLRELEPEMLKALRHFARMV